MKPLPMYLRREPTTDQVTINCQKSHGGRLPQDVVAYRDIRCTMPAGRWPWHYHFSKPHIGCQRVSLNCMSWEARWLPDKEV